MVKEGNKMTKYQYYMSKADEEITKAIKFAQKGEQALAQFHKNASNGFKEKALNLSIEEGEKEI